jgi:hypothetical protein
VPAFSWLASLLASIIRWKDRAEKETREYTQRYCPTLVKHMQMTVTVSFTRATKTFNYYYKLCGGG